MSLTRFAYYSITGSVSQVLDAALVQLYRWSKYSLPPPREQDVMLQMRLQQTIAGHVLADRHTQLLRRLEAPRTS